MSIEAQLLILGAAIGLVSSLVTLIAGAFLNLWMEKKKIDLQRKRELNQIEIAHIDTRYYRAGGISASKSDAQETQHAEEAQYVEISIPWDDLTDDELDETIEMLAKQLDINPALLKVKLI